MGIEDYSNFSYQTAGIETYPDYFGIKINFNYLQTPVFKQIYISLNSGINVANYMQFIRTIFRTEESNGKLQNYVDTFLKKESKIWISFYDALCNEINRVPYIQKNISHNSSYSFDHSAFKDFNPGVQNKNKTQKNAFNFSWFKSFFSNKQNLIILIMFIICFLGIILGVTIPLLLI